MEIAQFWKLCTNLISTSSLNSIEFNILHADIQSEESRKKNRSHFRLGTNAQYWLTIIYDFWLITLSNLLLISEVVAKFRYKGGLKDLKYGHAE